MRQQSVRAEKTFAVLVGGSLVAGGLVWWLRRSQGHAASEGPSSQPQASNQDVTTPEQVSPPRGGNPELPAALRTTPEALTFEDAPLSVEPSPTSNPPSVTARPTPRYPAVSSADDWDSVDPEELGEAFLTRATETTTDPREEDDEDARLLEVWKSGV